MSAKRYGQVLYCLQNAFSAVLTLQNIFLVSYFSNEQLFSLKKDKNPMFLNTIFKIQVIMGNKKLLSLQ